MPVPQISPFEWNPGLDNDTLTLEAVYEGMPKDGADTVPWIVKLLENPQSPIALAGAIDLFGHDCVHIVLGRGLLPQDEAFVLGYTMGSTPLCSPFQARLFTWCSQNLYRGAYRFSDVERAVFAFAFSAARTLGSAPLDGVDFHAWRNRPIRALRHALGVDPERIALIQAREAALWPGTAASRRLPLGCSPSP